MLLRAGVATGLGAAWDGMCLALALSTKALTRSEISGRVPSCFLPIAAEPTIQTLNPRGLEQNRSEMIVACSHKRQAFDWPAKIFWRRGDTGHVLWHIYIQLTDHIFLPIGGN